MPDTAAISSARFVFPAAVSSLDDARIEELRSRLNARAADPSIFKQHAPTFFCARISTSAIDAYFTKMMPSSLRRFAADAQAGLSFQDSHKHDQLGIGRSLDGRYIESANGAEVQADIFTLGGLPELDGFIHRLRSGIASDVSISFAGGRHVCSICGKDMWRSRDCFHIPGIEYEVESEDGSRRRVQAIAQIEDASCTEVSAVYDGATPGCAIVKARLEAEAGRMTPRVARILSERYRSVNLDFIADLLKAPLQRKAETMPPEEEKANLNPEAEPETEEKPKSAAPVTNEESVAIDEVLVGAEISEAERVNRAQGLRHVLVLAKEGRSYRKALVDEALAEGVRALGQGFNPENYKAVFANATPEAIRGIRDDFAKQASLKYPGGRQTVEKETTQNPRGFELPADVWG